MAAGDKQDPFSAATAQLTFHNFLEKMRHPSAVDLVRSIKSFIVSFQASPPDPDKDSATVQQFLAQTEASFRAHPLWAGATEEDVDSAGEGLEKYLLTKVFARAFGPTPEDAAVDTLLSARMAALQTFLRPEHLDIPDSFGNEPSWLLAQKEVGKLGAYKAPRDKLVCLLNCCRVINNLLLNMAMAHQGDPPGADDFLPVLIYVIIKANPPAFHSNLMFIQRYRSTSRLVSESAYFFTNAVSAAAFVQHLNASSLTMDPADFEAKMQHALAQSLPPPEVTTPSPAQNASPPPEKAGDLPPRHSRSRSDGGGSPRVAAVQPSGLSTSGSSPALATVDAVAGGSIARVPVPPPSPGLNVSAADSASAPLTQPVDTLAQLEAHGAPAVVSAAINGVLARDYRFLYTSVGDLRVGDVEALLTDYKELVLKYEVLVRGLQERNTGLARQLNVTGDGRGSRGVAESEENSVEGGPGERKSLEALEGMPMGHSEVGRSGQPAQSSDTLRENEKAAAQNSTLGGDSPAARGHLSEGTPRGESLGGHFLPERLSSEDVAGIADRETYEPLGGNPRAETETGNGDASRSELASEPEGSNGVRPAHEGREESSGAVLSEVDDVAGKSETGVDNEVAHAGIRDDGVGGRSGASDDTTNGSTGKESTKLLGWAGVVQPRPLEELTSARENAFPSKAAAIVGKVSSGTKNADGQS